MIDDSVVVVVDDLSVGMYIYESKELQLNYTSKYTLSMIYIL